jgi:hypothetical protein
VVGVAFELGEVGEGSEEDGTEDGAAFALVFCGG